MAEKMDRKTMPTGHSAQDFEVLGRAATDQGDFGSAVGVADMACVDQFGKNNSKYYHASVVRSTRTGSFYVYLEWGRIFNGHSWTTGFHGQDYQFVACSNEGEARDFFSKQCQDKNLKRLVSTTVGGVKVWTAKPGKDGYLVQSLATRERGLPDAYKIKDAAGVKVAAPTTPVVKKATIKSSRTYHPQVVKIASDLIGGVKTYTKALAAASGMTPTMDAITQVRDGLIPAALERIKVVGNLVDDQIQDRDLVGISKMVSALVPRPIPRTGISAAEAILNSDNIFRLQQDLDTFEASLANEDFVVEENDNSVNPDSLLNATLTWLDPKGDGAAIVAMLRAQTNNRHGYLSSPMKVLNLFQVDRPDRDAQFLANVRTVASRLKGHYSVKAGLQPKVRTDIPAEEQALYRDANVILTQHGTRSVNVGPIVQTHFRMPKSLSGVQITGANFGYGTYTATDLNKAVGYTSYERSHWSGGGGGIAGRGAFMFMTETLMGDAYLAPSTGSWDKAPNGKDSVFGRGGDRGHGLQNDEHVVFHPHYNRIRYLVEFTY